MKRWWAILEEKPSQDLERRIFDQVELEMAETRRLQRRDLWRKILYGLIPASVAVAAAFWLRPQAPTEQGDLDMDLEFADLVLSDDELTEEDLESLEDLAILENLEELEKWNS